MQPTSHQLPTSHGSALHSRGTFNDAGSPSTHTPGARTQLSSQRKTLREGNQQMLSQSNECEAPGPDHGLPGPPSGLCRGYTATAHRGCPALGPPASSQCGLAASLSLRPLGRHFHPGSFSPGAHVPESPSARFMGRASATAGFCSGQSAPYVVMPSNYWRSGSSHSGSFRACLLCFFPHSSPESDAPVTDPVFTEPLQKSKRSGASLAWIASAAP